MLHCEGQEHRHRYERHLQLWWRLLTAQMQPMAAIGRPRCSAHGERVRYCSHWYSWRAMPRLLLAKKRLQAWCC